MSYIINKTDGTVLTEVVDGTVDQIKTDITLVGKNATSYGEFFNENFVKILENFANTSQPNNPLEGQLWYDTTEGRLKVYDGSSFKVSGGTIVATEVPSSIASGDIWIDSYRQQMYFNDGTANLLAGPIYTAQQGITGWQSVDVVDTNKINHTTLFLYVGQVLLGIFSSSTTEFTPAESIPGFTGNIKVGFNASNINGLKFNVPSSQADALVADDGTLKTAESFLQVSPIDGYVVSNGTIRVLNSTSLVLGPSQNTEVKHSSNTLQINSNVPNQNFSIQSLNGSGLLPSMYINATNQYVGLYTDVPAATLDVNGDTIIRGDLTVEGSLTTISTTNVEIADKLIELAKVDTPSNSTADGGGILVEAGTDGDKTWTWSSSHSSWESSENINLVAGKVIKVSNNSVLSATHVYVTDAPNLARVGTLDYVQVAKVGIADNIISYEGVAADGDINIVPKGAGTINANSTKVSNLMYETDIDGAPTTVYDDTDAAPIGFVNYQVQSAPLGFTANIGSLTLAQFAAQFLIKIFPLEEHPMGTKLRVYVPDAMSSPYSLTSEFIVFTRDTVAWVQTDYIV